jgi:NAD(P)-dependent dehydrogenase (short-subunit alcohol dehydrogenase family)
MTTSSTFDPRCVVITGSSRGIGFGLAQAFLKRGCHLVVSGRDRASLDRALNQLQDEFGTHRVIAQCCDVADPQSVQALWDAAYGQFGQVDIWINNAGTCHPTLAFAELSPDQLQCVINTNVLGTAVASHQALRGMLAQGHGQLLSMEGWGSQGQISAGTSAYTTSKRAVSHLVRAIRKEVQNPAIQLGLLSPGMVATDLLIDSWTQGDAANWQRMRRLFLFVIDPPEPVCAYLAERVLGNRKPFTRIAWMTPWRLFQRLFSPYYWRRNPLRGTALDQMDS